MAQSRESQKAMFAKQNLRTLPHAQLQQGIDDRKKLPKHIVENLIREKVRRSGKDTCGVCGTEFKDKGACRVCDAEDERRARNWSTMTQEQRERFFRRHGLENDFAVTTQAKLPFKELTKHWQEELKKDGFGK
jgi:hypothetical protein